MEDAIKKRDRELAAARERIAALDDENQTVAQYTRSLQDEVAALKQSNASLAAEKEKEKQHQEGVLAVLTKKLAALQEAEEKQRREGELAAENKKLATLLEAEKKNAEEGKKRAEAQFERERKKEEGWREGLRAHLEKEIAARDEKLGAWLPVVSNCYCQ